MKITHVILGYSEHFLVIDGKRGPLCTNQNSPAYHPAGFIKYRSDCDYSIRDEIKGRIFSSVLPVDSLEVEEIKDTVCEPAQAKWEEWREVSKTCTDIKLSRYEEYKTENQQ